MNAQTGKKIPHITFSASSSKSGARNEEKKTNNKYKIVRRMCWRYTSHYKINMSFLVHSKIQLKINKQKNTRTERKNCSTEKEQHLNALGNREISCLKFLKMLISRICNKFVVSEQRLKNDTNKNVCVCLYIGKHTATFESSEETTRWTG